MPTYNGHKNWNHWNVSLWLNNDEGLYRTMQHAVKFSCTRAEAARRVLNALNDTHTPDGAPYTLSSIRAAMVGM